VSAGSDGNMSIWNTETCKVVRNLKGHNKGILSLKVLRNGNLARGSWDNTIKLWNTQSGHILRTFKGHKDDVNTLEELNGDGLLVSGSRDKTVKIWELETGNMLKISVEMPDSVGKLVLLRDDHLIIQCWNLSQIIILNGKNLSEMRRSDCGKMYGAMTMLGDGNLATCNEKIKIWNVISWKLLRILDGHEKGINCLHLLDDGSLASGSGNGEIQMWNPTNGQLLHSFKSHDYYISSMTTLSDGCFVSCSGNCKDIKLWKKTSGATNAANAPQPHQ
jgi:WD40 repeat protein